MILMDSDQVQYLVWPPGVALGCTLDELASSLLHPDRFDFVDANTFTWLKMTDRKLPTIATLSEFAGPHGGGIITLPAPRMQPSEFFLLTSNLMNAIRCPGIIPSFSRVMPLVSVIEPAGDLWIRKRIKRKRVRYCSLSVEHHESIGSRVLWLFEGRVPASKTNECNAILSAFDLRMAGMTDAPDCHLRELATELGFPADHPISCLEMAPTNHTAGFHLSAMFYLTTRLINTARCKLLSGSLVSTFDTPLNSRRFWRRHPNRKL